MSLEKGQKTFIFTLWKHEVTADCQENVWHITPHKNYNLLLLQQSFTVGLTNRREHVIEYATEVLRVIFYNILTPD